jgi:Domain of unknown function (DUF4397)
MMAAGPAGQCGWCEAGAEEAPMKILRRRLGGLGAALAMVLLLAGCGGGEAGNGRSSLRLLNLSNGYAALDLWVDDSRRTSAVAQGGLGDYVAVNAGEALSTVLTLPGSTTALASGSRTLAKDTAYTLLAYGWSGALKTTLLQEDVAAADGGKAKLMVMNLAPDAGTLDVYLTGADEALEGAAAVAGGVAGGASVGHFSHGAGTFRLRVTGAGAKSDLRLDLRGLVLASTEVATLLLTPGSGGVLVNAQLLVQKGQARALANTQARARLVASLSGNPVVAASVAGQALASGLISPAVGPYVLVGGQAGAPVQLAINGRAVAAPAQAMPAGGDYTLLVWGTADAPQVGLVTDDNRLPADAGQAKVRLVNGLNGLGAGLTLTADFSALASDVALGQASQFSGINAASNIRLEVSSPLSTAPLYSVTNVALVARGLYTVFMLGDGMAPVPALRRER